MSYNMTFLLIRKIYYNSSPVFLHTDAKYFYFKLGTKLLEKYWFKHVILVGATQNKCTNSYRWYY